MAVAGVMDATDTDGWAVYRHGSVLEERYPRGMTPTARHLLMSVSKSLVGMTAGVLVSQGLLDLERPVESYLPGVAASGYAGASVRDLLDMRSGIAFSEDYLDPLAEVRVMEQVIGWAPRTVPGLPPTLYDFLAGLHVKGPHGGPFEYRSCETNMLGWVCEAAAGAPMTTLLSDLLWQPMGAELDAYIGVDAAGNGLYDGGICASLRDLLRFGSLLLNEGVAPHGAQVLPPAWVADTWNGAPDSAAAFATSPTVTLMPGDVSQPVLVPLGGGGMCCCAWGSTGRWSMSTGALGWSPQGCPPGPSPRTPGSSSARSPRSTPLVRRCPPEPRLATAESSSFRGVIETEDEPAETTGKLVQLLRCGVAPVPRGPQADPHLELAVADAQCEEPEPRPGR